MARTYRNIPKQGKYAKWMRTPKFKHKLLAGESPRQIVTDWDDKPIAARHEIKYRL